MTTTELIELLKKNERGGATGRPREVMFEVDDRIIDTDGIEVTGSGDGLISELYLSLPSAQPLVTDTNVPSRKGVFIPDITVEMFRNASVEGVEDLMVSGEMEDISFPSAQPDYQEVLGWLLAYHTKSFDLHGRYLPHEVISWLINDFTKEFIAERRKDEQS